MSPLCLSTLFLTAAAVLAGPRARATANPRPDVAVILTDDQDRADLGIPGNTGVATTRMATPARNSADVVHDVASPACSLIRAELPAGPCRTLGAIPSTSSSAERLDRQGTTVAGPPPASGPGNAPAGGFILPAGSAGRITSLRFDPAGRGEYGPETIAAGGSLEGFQTAFVDRDALTLSGPAGTRWRWDLPFARSGYYDADLHVNYPTPRGTHGAVPLVLPLRRFVSCTG